MTLKLNSIGPWSFEKENTVTFAPGLYILTEPVEIETNGKPVHICGVTYHPSVEDYARTGATQGVTTSDEWPDYGLRRREAE